MTWILLCTTISMFQKYVIITTIVYCAILSSLPAILLPALLANHSYYLVLLGARSVVCHFYADRACSTFPLVNPYSCWVIFLVSNFRSFSTNMWGEDVSLVPNCQPGGPGDLPLSGSSPLTHLAWEALPAAMLPQD